jgi:ArsR family transcriptional regulator
MRTAPLQRAEVLGPLTALADDTRLRLLELLAANGELRGQDLVVQMDVSQPNVSRHLKQLVGAGVVEERRAGDANKLYRLNLDGVRNLFDQLDQL